MGNRGGFLGHVLHIVGKAGVFAKVAVGQCLLRFVQIAAVILQQGRADLAMLNNERGQFAYTLKTGVF